MVVAPVDVPAAAAAEVFSGKPDWRRRKLIRASLSFKVNVVSDFLLISIILKTYG